MAVKQLAIEVVLESKKAYAELSKLERDMKSLERKKVKLDTDMSKVEQAKNELGKVDEELARLNQRKVELGVKMTYIEALESKLKQIKQQLLDFKDEKIILEFKLRDQKQGLAYAEGAYKKAQAHMAEAMSKGPVTDDHLFTNVKYAKRNFEEAKKAVEGTSKELQNCKDSIKSLNAYSANLSNTLTGQRPTVAEYKKTLSEIDRLTKKRDALELKVKNGEKVQQELDGVNKQLKELSSQKPDLEIGYDKAQEAQKAVMDLANSIDHLKAKASRNFAIGGGFEKIGDSMLHPIKFLGNNGNNWFGKLAYTATKGIAYSGLYRMTSGAMNTVDEGLAKGLERYDVNKAGKRTLNNMGIDIQTVDDQVNQLGKDLKGLPTSLNDGMTGMVSLTAVMDNNVGKARELFNAINDGVLANGGDTENTNRAIRQLSQSMGKGVIDAESFNSLLDNQMAPAIVQVAKMFGMNQAELKESLKDGTISVDQFTDALIKLDKEGNGAYKSLHTMALEANDGIQTNMTNAQNAIARGIEKILSATDSALSDTKYKGIGHIISMIGSEGEEALDGLAKWIESHKEDIVKGIDFIADGAGKLIDKAKSFDYKSFLGGLKESLSDLFDVISKYKGLAGNAINFAVDKLGGDPKALGQFVGEWIKVGTLVKYGGKALKTYARFQSTYAKIIDASSKSRLLKNIGQKTPLFSTGFGKIKGLFSKAPKVDASGTAGTVAAATGDLAQTGSAVKSFDLAGFKTNMAKLVEIGVAAGDIWLFAEALKNVGQIKLDDGFAAKLGVVAASMGGMYAITTAASKLNERLKVNPVQVFTTLVELAGGAADIMLYAEAMQQVNDKVPSNFNDITKKLMNLALTAGGMGAFTAIVGGLMLKFPALAAGEIVGLVGLAAVAGELILWAQAMHEFDTKCPTDMSSVQQKLNTMDTVMLTLSGMNILNSLAAITDTLGAFDTLMKSASLSNIVGMAKKLEELNEVDVSYDNINKVERMADLMESLTSERLLTSLGNAFSAWGDSKKFASGESMIANLSKMAKSLEALNGVEFDTDNAAAKAEQIIEIVRKLSGTRFPDIGDNFTPGNVDKAVTAMSEMGKLGPAMKSMGDVLSADNAQIDPEKLQAVLETLKNSLQVFAAQDFVSTVGTMPTTEEIDSTVNILTKIPEIVSKLNALKGIEVDGEAIKKSVTSITRGLEALSKAGIGDKSSLNYNLKELGTNAESYANAVSGIEKLKAVAEKLNSFAGVKVMSGDVMWNAKQLKQAVDEIVGENSIADAFSDYSDAGLDQGVAAMDKVKQIADKLSGFAGLELDSGKLTDLKNKIQQFLNEISGLQTEDAQARTDAIAAIVEDFKGLVNQLNELEGDYENIGSGWGNKLLAGWNDVKISTKMVDTIDAALKSLKDKESKFNDTGKAYGTKLVDGFNKSITGTSGLAAKLGTVAQNLASGQNIDMFRAAGETLGNALVDSYNRQMSRAKTPQSSGTTYTPAATPRTSGTGVLAGASDYINALLRRADGGSVPKTMTDTVPAVLTPGEFVVRRDAVRNGGKRLLKQINSGNLIGAYRNLQHRFGAAETISRVTNVSNVTNHNETTKTINIQGNLEDRGLELKAGRFMRALG